ncbi:MAG: AsnC family transcriptional regulator [Candidatus Marsarchaeota archaeon]|nr:AsnC family transcriptional regulator [Candidatus Marsarchaeota archaeon]
MPDVPIQVMRTLQKLRAEHSRPPYIILRKIHGGFYVYKDRIVKDKASNKSKIFSEYMGRITDDGLFVRRILSEDDKIANARAVIESAGGKVLLPGKGDENASAEVFTPDEIDTKILTILSMNARMARRSIAERVGLSTAGVDNRIKHLEKLYGISYTAEIDIEKMGYLKFLIFIKFFETVPPVEEIRSILSKEIRIQSAMMLSGGDYHLVIYVLAEKNLDVIFLIRDLRELTSLSKYPSEWTTTIFYETYNFMPLRDDFVDSFKERLGRRKPDILGEEPAKSEKTILNREFAVLKEINNNGRVEFTEIDRKYRFDEGRAQYSYHRLLEKGLLKRTTISMNVREKKYTAALFMKDVQSDLFYATRKNLLKEIISGSDTPVNKYALVGDIGLPYGVFFLLNVFHEGDIEKAKAELSKTKGIRLSAAIVTELVVGKLCVRRFDNAYALQNNTLKEKFGEVPLPKTSYS